MQTLAILFVACTAIWRATKLISCIVILCNPNLGKEGVPIQAYWISLPIHIFMLIAYIIVFKVLYQ